MPSGPGPRVWHDREGGEPHRFTHAGIEYLFCSAGCRTKFAADPDRFSPRLQRRATPLVPKKADPQAIYTCPMHPRCGRSGQVAVRVCGMALEPVTCP